LIRETIQSCPYITHIIPVNTGYSFIMQKVMHTVN